MPTFTIQVPDGRKVTVQATDQAQALAGVKDWYAKNPAPQPAQAQPQNIGAPAAAGNPPNQINLMDAYNRQYQKGKYAPAAATPTMTNNPQDSALPEHFIIPPTPFSPIMDLPLRRISNTFRAATQGGMDVSTLNMGDEATAGVMTAADALSGQRPDFGKRLAQNEQIAADTKALNPDAAAVGENLGALSLIGKAPEGTVVAPAVKGLIRRAALTGGAAGAIMGAGTPGTLQERAGHAAEQGFTSALLSAGGGVVGKMLAKSASSATPTVDELFTAARQAYKASETSGAVVSPEAMQQYATGLRKTLTDKGFITPSGKTAAVGNAVHALALAEDFATQPTTMAQLQVIRERLGDVAGSAVKAERNLGVKMIRDFDNFVVGLPRRAFVAGDGVAATQAWAAARDIWHTAEKGKAVESLLAGAKRTARKQRTTWYQEAVRSKFSDFAANEKKTRGFTPEEKAQIALVGEGTGVGRVAQGLARLSPKTLGSAWFHFGAPATVVGSGVTMLTGNPALGGVAGGVAGSGSIGLGLIGRAVSALSTRHQAELARLLVLNGGNLPKTIPNGVSPLVKRAVGTIMLAGGINAGRIVTGMFNAKAEPLTQ